MIWNEFRQRWIALFSQFGGETSLLGDLWYTEAASPLGPWTSAVRVLSHRDMSFYNPMIHVGLAPGGDKTIYFEGTFTTLFTDRATPIPRHNYNQILYALDLDHPGLKPAQP